MNKNVAQMKDFSASPTREHQTTRNKQQTKPNIQVQFENKKEENVHCLVKQIN